MDLHSETAFGFTAKSINKRQKEKIFNQGFVDDTSIAVNGGVSTQQLLDRLHHDAQSWNKLLFSSGGLLELSKCLYCIVEFKFDSVGNPILFTPEHQ
jgi:hypothetical protein